jgi:hypothetical protein
MSNPFKGEYILTINKTPFKIKFDTNAFAELEDVLKEPLPKILAQMEHEVSFKFIRAALYAGMLHNPKLQREKWTIEKAGSLINIENLHEIARGVMMALASALSGKSPDEITAEAEKPKPVASETDVEGSEESPLPGGTGMNTE